jgi:hypothetical protein
MSVYIPETIIISAGKKSIHMDYHYEQTLCFQCQIYKFFGINVMIHVSGRLCFLCLECYNNNERPINERPGRLIPEE